MVNQTDRVNTMTQFPEPIRHLAGIMPSIAHEAKTVLGERWEFGATIEEDYAVEAFTRHTAAVQGALPSDRLLVFEAGQGWTPLCEFLDVDPPADEPFPHLNEVATVQRMFQNMVETNTFTAPFDGGD